IITLIAIAYMTSKSAGFALFILTLLFFFTDSVTTEIYTLSLHDALPILLLRAETRIAMRRFNLRQTVIAAFAPDLRPEWCALEAALDSGRVALEAEIGRNGAVTRHRSAGREREGRVEFDRPPLLLLDNCFASHALAALGAMRHPQAAAIFVSLPAFEDLPVTRPGVLRVL